MDAQLKADLLALVGKRVTVIVRGLPNVSGQWGYDEKHTLCGNSFCWFLSVGNSVNWFCDDDIAGIENFPRIYIVS